MPPSFKLAETVEPEPMSTKDVVARHTCQTNIMTDDQPTRQPYGVPTSENLGNHSTSGSTVACPSNQFEPPRRRATHPKEGVEQERKASKRTSCSSLRDQSASVKSRKTETSAPFYHFQAQPLRPPMSSRVSDSCSLCALGGPGEGAVLPPPELETRWGSRNRRDRTERFG